MRDAFFGGDLGLPHTARVQERHAVAASCLSTRSLEL